MHIYSELSLTVFNGTYSQENSYRIVVLIFVQNLLRFCVTVGTDAAFKHTIMPVFLKQCRDPLGWSQVNFRWAT